MGNTVSLNSAEEARAANWTIKNVPLRTRLQATTAARKANKPVWQWLDWAVEVAAAQQDRNTIGPTEGPTQGSTIEDDDLDGEQNRLGIGFVYIVGREIDALLKIGKTNQLQARMSSLKMEHGPITVHHFIRVERPRMVEAHTHDLLRNFHHGGEWFDISVETAIYAVHSANKTVKELYNRANSSTAEGQLVAADAQIALLGTPKKREPTPLDILNAPRAPKWLIAAASRAVATQLGIPLPPARKPPGRLLAAPEPAAGAGTGVLEGGEQLPSS